MRINGRGRPVGRVIGTPEGISIRVDDERNDEFWLEIALSLEELAAALALAKRLDAEIE